MRKKLQKSINDLINDCKKISEIDIKYSEIKELSDIYKLTNEEIKFLFCGGIKNFSNKCAQFSVDR